MGGPDVVANDNAPSPLLALASPQRLHSRVRRRCRGSRRRKLRPAPAKVTAFLQLDPTPNFVIPSNDALQPPSARCMPSIRPVSFVQRIIPILDSISQPSSRDATHSQHVGHPRTLLRLHRFTAHLDPLRACFTPASLLYCHAAHLIRPTPLVRGRVVAAWAPAAIDRIHKWPLL